MADKQQIQVDLNDIGPDADVDALAKNLAEKIQAESSSGFHRKPKKKVRKPPVPPSPEEVKEAQRLKLCGNKAMQAGQYELAAQWYSTAISLKHEQNVVLFSNRAAALLKLGRGVEALMDAEWVVTLKPNWPKGHFRRGCALMALGNHEHAIQAFKDGLKLAPSNEDLQEKLRLAEESHLTDPGPHPAESIDTDPPPPSDPEHGIL